MWAEKLAIMQEASGSVNFNGMENTYGSFCKQKYHSNQDFNRTAKNIKIVQKPTYTHVCKPHSFAMPPTPLNTPVK